MEELIYEKPEMEIVYFETTDIITSSKEKEIDDVGFDAGFGLF